MINSSDHNNRWLKVMFIIDGSIFIRTTFCFRLRCGGGGCVNNKAGGEVHGGAGDCVLSQEGGEV